MFIACPNGGGPPVDGAGKSGVSVASAGTIDVRVEVQLRQLAASSRQEMLIVP